MQREYGRDSTQAIISSVDKIKTMGLEDDEHFTAFLAQKTGASADSLKLDELIDLYVSVEEIAAEQARLNKARIVMMNVYLASHPDLVGRMIIAEETTNEGAKKRPRFMLSYAIAE